VIQNVRCVSLIKLNVVMLGVPGSQLDYFVVSILCHSVSWLHCCGDPDVARLQLLQQLSSCDMADPRCMRSCMSCLKHALAVLLTLLQPNAVDNYQHCEVQAKSPDAYSPPPDVRRDEDTTRDNPDEAEPDGK